MRSLALRSSLRPFAGLVAVLALALAPVACRRSPGPPSAEYEEASRRWRSLYAQKLDDAYLDPSVGEIEALLQRVPADSLDAASARELQNRLEEGRTRMTQAASERDRAVASATAPSNEDPTRTNFPRAQAASPDAGAPDSGAPDAGGPGPQVGSPASELVAGYRGCFRRGSPITVEGRGDRESWELADRASCQLEYPGHVNSLLVVEEGKVLALFPRSALRTVQKLADGGTVPVPGDAGR
ncbi:hypothetical protein DRW03_27005 [Corallococcus sp. H22C18031201]|uniref:hypothetical protein n=1 Tax=Citreicoccus inhibens TaxID=2849499 RepID=UPI000E758480|nr:hypothetical protein [Citreicoccus inhibens]MBU8894795.1 hypothetical protein [Citreicoccus inhibens]RJS17643.1 hypothetical protein DRW03_27005 [Corallococcus sp. H22C18031201]